MFDPQLPMTTDADLLAMANELVGVACRRQTWLLLLDEEQRVLTTALPVIDGVPVDPDPEDVAGFATMISGVVDRLEEARSTVLVWERPGSAEVRMLEADWIAALAATTAPIRAQLIASDAGVHLVDPEFAALTAG